jgi:hypothetical protein
MGAMQNGEFCPNLRTLWCNFDRMEKGAKRPSGR